MLNWDSEEDLLRDEEGELIEPYDPVDKRHLDKQQEEGEEAELEPKASNLLNKAMSLMDKEQDLKVCDCWSMVVMVCYATVDECVRVRAMCMSCFVK